MAKKPKVTGWIDASNDPLQSRPGWYETRRISRGVYTYVVPAYWDGRNWQHWHLFWAGDQWRGLAADPKA